MKTRVTIEIDAPLEVVWAEAVDFSTHHEWMSDAASIDFETNQRTGEGTVLLIETHLGPLRVLDRFEIVEIDAPRLIRGDHIGAVRGSATWHLQEIDGRTTLEWNERLLFPWFFAGRLGELVARPILHATWRANLRRLKSRIESAP